MAVTIKLSFPAGRYHATPWGRHVNEGVPEWPPSPWRLLRALIAVWKRTCPEISEPSVQRVLTALVAPPVFRLPPHRVAHTRHYMPWEKKGPVDRTLVFDTFVCISRKETLIIHWPEAALAENDRATLDKLVGNLTTFGRAEGWVHAELTDDVCDWNCEPSDATSDPIAVFCPDPASAFRDEHYPAHDTKKLAKGKVNPKAFLFDCPRWHLCLDTETIHNEKWPRVPGAKWVNYRIDRAMPIRTTVSSKEHPRFTIARFLVDGPVLPSITHTLPLAEAIRFALMGHYQRLLHKNKYGTAQKPYQERFYSPTFAGKDAQRQPLQGHRHAFYLPADEDDDVRLDHITIQAEQGFTPDEVRALDRLREVRLGESDPLRLLLVGLGRADNQRAWVLASSKTWVSATPFVVTRYPKLRGQKRDRPEDLATPQAFVRRVLYQELERLRTRRPDLPAVLDIVPLDGISRYRLRPIQFQRFRRKQDDDGGRRPSSAFRIIFAEPVQGPICLGHSCHFGLGLFVPEQR